MSRDKGLEKNIWGVSGLCRHYFFYTDKTGHSRLLEKVEETWEALRRYEGYKELCEGVEFQKNGLVDPTWIVQNMEMHDAITERLNQAGIKQPLDPEKSFSELPRDITMDIIGVVPVEVIAPKDPPLKFEDKKSYDKRFLEDDRYLTVKIDVSQRKEDIRYQVNLYLDYYQGLIDLPDTRHRDKSYWQVYDLWRERKTPTEIIKILWPDEYEKALDLLPTPGKKQDERYSELATKYRSRGLTDWNEKAYNEVYGDNIDKEASSVPSKLYKRVQIRLEKAEEKIKELERLRFKEKA